MSNYKIVKELATLRTDSRRQLRLNLMKWDNKPGVRYDIRLWYEGLPGDWTPGKGIILSESEAQMLVRVLEDEILLAGRQAAEEAGEHIVAQYFRPAELTTWKACDLAADPPDDPQAEEIDAPDGP